MYVGVVTSINLQTRDMESHQHQNKKYSIDRALSFYFWMFLEKWKFLIKLSRGNSLHKYVKHEYTESNKQKWLSQIYFWAVVFNVLGNVIFLMILYYTSRLFIIRAWNFYHVIFLQILKRINYKMKENENTEMSIVKVWCK